MTPEEEDALRAENAALREQVQALLAGCRSWKRRLAKDSHNSSKPPSSDGLRRKPKSLREKSGKQRGGAAGPSWPSGVAGGDARHGRDHRPSQCSACQHELPSDAPSWVERRQVSELPAGAAAGHRTPHPACALPSVWGDDRGRGASGGDAPRSNTARGCARCAPIWSQQQFVPYARVREVVADVFGAALSVGTLVNLVRQGAERLRGGRAGDQGGAAAGAGAAS